MARDVVGTVITTTPKGLIVKAPRMIPIGTPLVDVRNQPVGRVADVIGPVAAPYLVIATARGAKTQRLLSRELYTP